MIFKETRQILNTNNYEDLFNGRFLEITEAKKIFPLKKIWKEKRKISFKDVEVWEVISEWGYGSGVYAAWNPYSHYFILVENKSVVEEFWGVQGEKKMRDSLMQKGIFLVNNLVWFDEEYIEDLKNIEKMNNN